MKRDSYRQSYEVEKIPFERHRVQSTEYRYRVLNCTSAVDSIESTKDYEVVVRLVGQYALLSK